MLTLLLVTLAAAALAYAALLLRGAIASNQVVPRLEPILLGAITNFLDTLGVGSFAPSMAWMRFRRLVPDRLIPLTMLAGYILPSVAQALIFLVLLGVRVDPWLIIGCSAAMIVGGVLGVPIALRSPIRRVQAIIGVALLMAASFYTLSNLGLMPVGGTATSLSPTYFAIAIAAHLLFGILISFGVGNYAPTLAMLSLFGMDPHLAFPIMACAASFAGCASAARIVGNKSIDLRIAIGLTLGAVPAVLVAAFVVRDMPVTMLRWLVAAVVTYAGVALLITAARRIEEPLEERIEHALIG
ncbi:MAG: sulfite exporter TauE/SafE family protein [Pseudomonadota bacterium]|nr:sulfite exporter TauE/SafE family protein [Pseudomonadota bacterium]